MKKKVISMLIAAAMIGSFAGCGAKKSATSDDGIPTLTWLMPCETQEDLQSVEDAMNEIFVEKVGARVDFEFIDEGAYSEKMRMKMASGEAFDMCFTGYVNNYTTAARSGGLLDITDLIDEVDGLRDAIPDYNWEAATINGKIYCVPNVQIACMSTAVVEYTDISKDYDFDFSKVKHVEDIEPYLEMIKKADPSYYPFKPAYGVSPWIDGKYVAVGTKMIGLPIESTSTDDLCYIWETEEWQDGVRTMSEWYKKGYIRPDVLSVNDDTNDRKGGGCAIDQELWKPGVEVGWKTSFGRDSKFWVVVPPMITRGMATSTNVSLGLSCKDPKKALEIVKLMHTDAELLNLLTFGIEGKHYNLVNDRVEVIEGAGYDQDGAAWKFGNTYLAHLVPGQEDSVWEETKEVNETAIRPSTLAFSFDSTPVKTEIAALNTLYTEYEVYNRGAADPDTYLDEFVKKMKEAGIEKVYNEVKKQLDEYFASQK